MSSADFVLVIKEVCPYQMLRSLLVVAPPVEVNLRHQVYICPDAARLSVSICIVGVGDLCKRIFGGETSSHHGGDGSALKVRAKSTTTTASLHSLMILMLKYHFCQ